MKAIIYHKYGSADVLELKDIPKPGDKDMKFLQEFMLLSPSMDYRFRQGKNILARILSIIFKPGNLILGTEFSGIIPHSKFVL